MKPEMIVMMGGQGVGKGTFSRMLCARDKYKYVETGAILRALPPDSEIGKIIAAGNLTPDDKLFELMAQHFNPNDGAMILDGFPRTIGQAQWLVKNFADKFDIHVLYLDAPREILIQRIQKRVREGGNRQDDSDTTIINRRLDNFYNITMPTIEWLRTAPGIKFSDIDSRGPEPENFNEILIALNKK